MHEIDLLRQYVRDGSQPAFAGLVERYIHVVYSAALRQLGDAHQAEDITQAVFAALAQDARRIRDGTVLCAWLLTTTRHLATRARTSEARRKQHERRAAEMNSEPCDDGRWRQIAPDLDEAIAELAPASRSALLLRFFEGRTFREVGEQLNISEDAAKQRVGRALEQLRQFFGERGVAMPSETLGALLLANAVQAAPAGLAAASTAAGLAASAATTATAGISKGALTIMTLAKAKLAAVGIVAAALVGSTSLLVHQLWWRERDIVIAVPESATHTGATPAITGVVKTPAGTPAMQADIFLATPGVSSLIIRPSARQANAARRAQTDNQGHFTLQDVPEWHMVVAVHEAGYAELTVNRFGQAAGEMVLQPWGRIEGTLHVADQPRPGQAITARPRFDPQRVAQLAGQPPRLRYTPVEHNLLAQTDAQGRFTLDRVPPGEWWVGPLGADGVSFAAWRVVRVEPGAAARVVMAAPSRMVTGRVSQDGAARRLLAAELMPAQADALDSLPSTPIALGVDGSFRVTGLPPGRYQLIAHADGRDPAERIVGQAEFVVPAGDTAVHLGDLTLRALPNLAAAGPAGDLIATTPAGDAWALSEHRDRHIVIHNWDPALADGGRMLDYLYLLQDRFGHAPDFSIIGILASGEAAWVRPLLDEVQLPWPTLKLDPSAQHGPLAAFLSPPHGRNRALMRLVTPEGEMPSPPGRGGIYSILDSAIGMGVSSAPHVKVVHEHIPPAQATPAFAFTRIPTLASDDAGQRAIWTAIEGQKADYGGDWTTLNDGAGPRHHNDERLMWTFAPGTVQGRLRADLGRIVPVREINTYSWFRNGNRYPQVYRIYGSNGAASGFNPEPRLGTDPTRCGWDWIATVDTRPTPGGAGLRDNRGGQDGVSIRGAAGLIGRYRYVLIVTFATETHDQWGQTFWSEIDIVEGK